jgi:hypothetical protein
MTKRAETHDRHVHLIETARKLECDEDEARLKEKLATIAGMKQEDEPRKLSKSR